MEQATETNRFRRLYDRGLSVFPVPPLAKIPGMWRQYQTEYADPFIIPEWDASDDNVGFATGEISNIVVLDLDNEEALERLSAIRDLPPTAVVKTPRGYHLYYSHPGERIRNKAGLHILDPDLPQGIDIRGDGGFAMGPGSYYCPEPEEAAKGKREGPYRFIAGMALGEIALAPMPAWLLELVREKPFEPVAIEHPREIPEPYAEAALAGEIDRIMSASPGTRNDTLYKASAAIGQLVAAGALEELHVTSELVAAGQRMGQGIGEARATVRSGLHEGMKTPRELPERPKADIPQASPRPPVERPEAARPTFGGNAFRASQVLDIEAPEQQWVIADLIPHGHVTTLFGDGGVGKSLLVQTLASHIASGQPFADRHCEQMPVAAIMCEDDDAELNRRQRRINKRLFTNEEVEDFVIMSRVGEDNVLGSVEGGRWVPSSLYAEIEAWVLEERIRVLIIDNIMQVFGGDINDNQAVTWFVNSLTRLARKMDGAVILLGHVAKSENSRFSGSMAWNNSVRARLNLSRADAEGCSCERRVLTVDKSNYGKAGITIELALTDGVLIDRQSLSQEETGEIRTRAIAARFAITTLLKRVGSVSTSYQSPAYIFSEENLQVLTHCGATHQAIVQEQLRAMIAEKKLIKVTREWGDRAKKKRERIVLADEPEELVTIPLEEQTAKSPMPQVIDLIASMGGQ